MSTQYNKQGIPINKDLLVTHPEFGVFIGYKDGKNSQEDVFFVKEFEGQSNDKKPFAILGCIGWSEIPNVQFTQVNK